jgi:Ca-activated chloride channel family protein
LLAPALARAQGLLIVDDPNQQVRLPRPIIIWPPHPWPHPRPMPPPMPSVSYKIKQLGVQARLIDQVAEVKVSQTFQNNGSLPMEAAFVFPLPYDGAISQMTLMIDGREFPAKLLGAADARRMYEEIVRRNRDPALLEWMGTGLFRGTKGQKGTFYFFPQKDKRGRTKRDRRTKRDILLFPSAARPA